MKTRATRRAQTRAGEREQAKLMITGMISPHLMRAKRRKRKVRPSGGQPQHTNSGRVRVAHAMHANYAGQGSSECAPVA